MPEWNIIVDPAKLWERFSPKTSAEFVSTHHDAGEHAKHNISILPAVDQASSIRRIRWFFYYPLWVQTEGDARKLAAFLRSSLGTIQQFAATAALAGSGAATASIANVSDAVGNVFDVVESFDRLFDHDTLGTVPGRISVEDFAVTFRYEGQTQPVPAASYAYKLEARAFWVTDDDLPDSDTFGTVRCTEFEYDVGQHAPNNDMKRSSDTERTGTFKNPLVAVGPKSLTNLTHNVAFYVDATSQIHEITGTRTFGTLIFGLMLYIKAGSQAECQTFIESDPERQVGMLLQDLRPESRYGVLASALRLNPGEAALIRSVGLGVENPAGVLASGLSVPALKTMARSIDVPEAGIVDANTLASAVVEKLGVV